MLSDVEAAEVRQVKHELAEKEEELERVRERRDLLASECEAVRVERDVLRRSNADMTKRMAGIKDELFRTRDVLVSGGSMTLSHERCCVGAQQQQQGFREHAVAGTIWG